MLVVLIVGVKVRQGGEHWEEVYWISLEAHFERHADIVEHTSCDPTKFLVLAQIVSFQTGCYVLQE